MKGSIQKSIVGFWGILALGTASYSPLWAHSTGVIEGTVSVTAPARQEVDTRNAMDEDNSASNGYDDYGGTENNSQAIPKAPPISEEIVVYLQKVPGHWKAPLSHAKLDQKYTQFTHRALPILVGTTVDFTNHDPIYHNIFSNSEENPKFDLGRRKNGETKSVTFNQVEVPVKLFCEIHPKMASNILVLQNPFFTVVNPGGIFRIEGIPPGTYTLEAWHDYWQPVDSKITVKAGRTKKIEITLSQARK
jgi:plastocyanin